MPAVKPITYSSEMGMFNRKIEHAMKGSDLYIQIHPVRNIKNEEISRERTKGKGPTHTIMNALEDVIPQVITDINVITPKPYINQYTVVVKDFDMVIGDRERVIGKIVEALRKMPRL